MLNHVENSVCFLNWNDISKNKVKNLETKFNVKL